MKKPFDDMILTPLQRKMKELNARAKQNRLNRNLPTLELAQNIVARQEGHISWEKMVEHLKSKHKEGDKHAI